MSEAIAAAGPETERPTGVIARNPNASVALGSGSGVGALVVWIVSLSGTTMPPEVGAAIGGVVAAAALFIGRRGIRGALATIWRGEAGG
jgi:hypothetical protein